MKKTISKKALHIIIILIGIVFVSFSMIHINMCFSDAYSVGIANHSLGEMCNLSKVCAYPMFYYFCLHILSLIFGNNIIVYRIFSIVCISLLGLLGFTHIRKDFGEKAGLLFSILVFFLPISVLCAERINMYILSILLLIISFIYAYRIYKSKKSNKKNWILYTISSILAAYTHYLAFIVVCLINILFYIKKYKKAKKNTDSKKMFKISVVSQAVLYIPCLIVLIIQLVNGFNSPGYFKKLLTFPIKENINSTAFVIGSILILIFYMCLLINTIYKKKKDNISETAKNVIKVLSIIICICSIGVSIFIKHNQVQMNYDYFNESFFEFCEGIIEKDDIILISNGNKNWKSGFIISAYFPEAKVYFWNQNDIKDDNRYKVFGNGFTAISDLNDFGDYVGRIWIIDDENYSLYESVYDHLFVSELKQSDFIIEYNNEEFYITLVEIE